MRRQVETIQVNTGAAATVVTANQGGSFTSKEYEGLVQKYLNEDSLMRSQQRSTLGVNQNIGTAHLSKTVSYTLSNPNNFSTTLNSSGNVYQHQQLQQQFVSTDGQEKMFRYSSYNAAPAPAIKQSGSFDPYISSSKTQIIPVSSSTLSANQTSSYYQSKPTENIYTQQSSLMSLGPKEVLSPNYKAQQEYQFVYQPYESSEQVKRAKHSNQVIYQQYETPSSAYSQQNPITRQKTQVVILDDSNTALQARQEEQYKFTPVSQSEINGFKDQDITMCNIF